MGKAARVTAALGTASLQRDYVARALGERHTARQLRVSCACATRVLGVCKQSTCRLKQAPQDSKHS